MNRAITILLSIISLLGIGYIAGSVMSKKTVTVEVPVYKEKVITQVDTVYIDKPVVKYVTKAHTDTVFMETERAGWELISTTSVDLQADETRYGTVDIEYIHDPWDEFNTTFHPAPLPIITKTVTAVQYRPQPLRYYQKPAFNWVVGAVMGGIIVKWASDHE